LKRAYQKAASTRLEGGFGVTLDGKPLSTPMQRPIAVPTRALAEAIAAEWQEQGEEVRPCSMPLTQLAATALDRVADRREEVIGELAAYGPTDLLCYRTDQSVELARRQALSWQPVLDWFALRFDAPLTVTLGVIPKAQSPAALAALRTAVAQRDFWELSALALATHAAGSIVLALALAEGQIDAAGVWSLSLMDELFQAEQWGDDPQASARRQSIQQDLLSAERFLKLLRQG
jgi:chaperone required for assembly of F1-ATPase